MHYLLYSRIPNMRPFAEQSLLLRWSCVPHRISKVPWRVLDRPVAETDTDTLLLAGAYRKPTHLLSPRAISILTQHSLTRSQSCESYRTLRCWFACRPALCVYTTSRARPRVGLQSFNATQLYWRVEATFKHLYRLLMLD